MTETAPYQDKYVTYGADKIFRSTRPDVVSFTPTNMTADEFMFDFAHPTRAPVEGMPWFIDDDDGGRVITRDEAKQQAILLAGAFKEVLDLKVDEVVYFCSPNAIEYAYALWATFYLGGILASGSPVYTASEMGHQIEVVQTAYTIKAIMAHAAVLTPILEMAQTFGIPDNKIILLKRDTDNTHPESHRFLTVPDLLEAYANKPTVPRGITLGPNGAKTKVAVLAFSSGTTGLPKGVVISHYSLCVNTVQASLFAPGRCKPGTDRSIAVLPFFHVYGLMVILHYALYEGVALIPRPSFIFKDFLRVVQDYGVTILWTVPPMLILLAKDPLAKKYNLKKVRQTFCGAAPIGKDLVQAYQEVVPASGIHCGFGMTETATVCCTSPEDPASPEGNSGILMNNMELKVVSPSTGEILGPGERGELYFRTPARAIGYLSNPVATAETFDNEGFIHSGDEGYISKDGWIYITDRIKELIKNRGVQVAPAELESHLLRHSSVDDVCVVGKYDDYAGELPKAWIVLKPSEAKKIQRDPKAAEEIVASICKLVSDHKSKSKHLTGGVEFIDAIPRTPSGKILRRVLRDIEKQRYAASQAKL